MSLNPAVEQTCAKNRAGLWIQAGEFKLLAGMPRRLMPWASRRL